MTDYSTKIQQYKVDAIGELKESFEKVDNFIFADYRGLNVEQITALRGKLRDSGAVFKVIKNRFAKIAMKELELPEVSDQLVGPTAFTMISDEAGAAAKILVECTAETSLKLKGGIIDGQVFDTDQLVQFSKLPGKSDLIAMLMSAMNGPIQGLVYAMQGVPQKLVRTLQAVADKKAEEVA
jgi:large subunit ribosomal protein L10